MYKNRIVRDDRSNMMLNIVVKLLIVELVLLLLLWVEVRISITSGNRTVRGAMTLTGCEIQTVSSAALGHEARVGLRRLVHRWLPGQTSDVRTRRIVEIVRRHREHGALGSRRAMHGHFRGLADGGSWAGRSAFAEKDFLHGAATQEFAECVHDESKMEMHGDEEQIEERSDDTNRHALVVSQITAGGIREGQDESDILGNPKQHVQSCGEYREPLLLLVGPDETGADCEDERQESDREVKIWEAELGTSVESGSGIGGAESRCHGGQYSLRLLAFGSVQIDLLHDGGENAENDAPDAHEELQQRHEDQTPFAVFEADAAAAFVDVKAERPTTKQTRAETHGSIIFDMINE